MTSARPALGGDAIPVKRSAEREFSITVGVCG